MASNAKHELSKKHGCLAQNNKDSKAKTSGMRTILVPSMNELNKNPLKSKIFFQRNSLEDLKKKSTRSNRKQCTDFNTSADSYVIYGSSFGY